MKGHALLVALKQGGPSGLVSFVRDRRQAEADRERLRQGNQAWTDDLDSSISDGGFYPLFCQLASSDDGVFNRFRRSLIYREILEHVDEQQGLSYLTEIEQAGSMLSQLEPLLHHDTIGQPNRFYYEPYGYISPTTLRYCKVAADLEVLFGTLEGMNVAEIGVGYGGQCRVVSSAWSLARYELFDIPEVLSLARRFLATAGVDLSIIGGSDGRDPQAGDWDLVISNYAFSELRREVQEMYLERVIQGSRRGYLTYNHISPAEWGSLGAQEFADRIPGAQILPEKPLTASANVIVAWGMNA